MSDSDLAARLVAQSWWRWQEGMKALCGPGDVRAIVTLVIEGEVVGCWISSMELYNKLDGGWPDWGDPDLADPATVGVLQDWLSELRPTVRISRDDPRAHTLAWPGVSEWWVEWEEEPCLGASPTRDEHLTYERWGTHAPTLGAALAKALLHILGEEGSP